MTAPGVSRRQLLVGGAALAFLTACSSDDSGSADSATTTTADPDSVRLLQLLPPQGVLIADGEQRVPVALAGVDGVPLREGLQPRDFQIRTEDGDPTVVTIEPRTDGVPTPYYPVLFTPPGTGILEISLPDVPDANAITFDIGDSTEIPTVGQAIPDLDTPTTDNARGVDPICTREPPCDLHAVSLKAALAAGNPIALSIATPQFCQTAICGPVLDLLIDELPDHPGITGIHAEVYADPLGNADPTAGGLSPLTEAFALPFEPTLYLIDATGTIRARLDSVYDRTELREALQLIT